MLAQSNKKQQPLIRIIDVGVKLASEISLDISWTINKGEHWAVIGANASGKSTLAKILLRQINYAHGTIHYFFDDKQPDQGRTYYEKGEIIIISPEEHRKLMRTQAGYHQARWQSIEGDDSPPVKKLLTGESIERISLHDKTPLKLPEDIYAARKQQAVSLLGIDYLLERKLLYVSNGEAQKVLLARALIQSPRLLILDDPFAGLDAGSRRDLMSVLKKLAATPGLQILLLTSRPEDVLQGITHVLCLASAKIVAQGKKQDILNSKVMEQICGEVQKTSDTKSFFPSFAKANAAHDPLLISMKNVTVSYEGVDVLSGINWKMRKGENWALLGPNGAGKSTLLSLILADNPQAYKNEISLFGRRRGSGESIWDIKRRMGWVSPELREYYEGRTDCFSVVCSGFFDSVGLHRRCSKKQQDKARRWLGVLGISHTTGIAFNTLSVGEQRLVLLCRALVKEPELLVLDEPFQALDSGRRGFIIRILDSLCNQLEVSLICVTHYENKLPRCITHILRLDRGRIVECGARKGNI
ncbi:MAG: ATP-binding cassette domain-containing protein [Spirochaetales bacterium]|nr:ATP-binding cassette domain-containing protein [Spirochaetales bacterium]